MNIRKAGPADVPLIRLLALRIWPETYNAILGQAQIDYMLELLYSETVLRGQMKQEHTFLLLHDHDEPVGFASFSLVEPFVYKLHKIYVLPSQQGKGAGRFIINYITDLVKTKGATALRLNVNRHNKARSFYEKLGFVIIKEEDIDIGSGYFMNDYVMEKKL